MKRGQEAAIIVASTERQRILVAVALFGAAVLAILILARPQLVAAQDVASEDVVSGGAVAETDPLVQALSGYHLTTTSQALEELAGGEDALVARLLEIRLLEQPPFVGVRAAKMLLEYSERQDVQDALASDMQSPQRLGLARSLLAHIDQVPNEGLRQRIARLAVERANGEPKFALYARSLKESSDPEVRATARALPQ